MKKIFLFSVLMNLVSHNIFAEDLGPFGPHEIILDDGKKKITFISEGQSREIKLPNYFARVEYHKKYDAPKGREDHIFGPIIFDVLKKEYDLAVTFAQVNHKKIKVDGELLQRIEFLSQFYHIFYNSIDSAGKEVLAYMDFLNIDAGAAKNEFYSGKIASLTKIIFKLNEKIADFKAKIAEAPVKFPVNVEELQKSCDIKDRSFYIEDSGLVSSPQYSLSLCLSKKLKYPADKADYAAFHILENVLTSKVLPAAQARLDEFTKLNQDLKVTRSSVNLKKAQKLFLADYEVLESKMTKVFKIVDKDVGVNEDNQFKEVFQDLPEVKSQSATNK
jgi:hypothetical protein